MFRRIYVKMCEILPNDDDDDVDDDDDEKIPRDYATSLPHFPLKRTAVTQYTVLLMLGYLCNDRVHRCISFVFDA